MRADGGAGVAVLSIDPEFREYPRDEAQLIVNAETICRPTLEEQLLEILAGMCHQGGRMTVQGARAGITGAAVPLGGQVIDLCRLNRIQGLGSATMQPEGAS